MDWESYGQRESVILGEMDRKKLKEEIPTIALRPQKSPARRNEIKLYLPTPLVINFGNERIINS